ncbi:EamA family transporter [Nocardioides cavernaquae]|uniref:EamA family transporter n=1 Tax=Nocardioides cavernaquae TaxID=2321396 RepID=A0A3A5HH72_9ACTN|nr:EamA family transporter [Nocardioides cavernaquae]RJS47037.1 EamA family transporter [Nocardioides cavernaquae]
MAVLLALTGALLYGVADFVGGLASRRTSPWAVAFVAAVAGAVLVILASPLLISDPTGADMCWGAVGGVGAGIGTGFLYRGLAGGRMGVVAPISGVGAAVVPVVVALAVGERPAALVWLGIVAALPGIWLVARDPGSGRAGTAGVIDGVLAGLGFGGQFAALSQVSEDGGLLPLGLNQLVAAAVVALLATGARAAWVPRDRAALPGVLCGALGVGATVAFVFARHEGSITVAAVLSGLYPAFTILLAATVLHEHIRRSQGLGLALCGVAVALVAAG